MVARHLVVGAFAIGPHRLIAPRPKTLSAAGIKKSEAAGCWIMSTDTPWDSARPERGKADLHRWPPRTECGVVIPRLVILSVRRRQTSR